MFTTSKLCRPVEASNAYIASLMLIEHVLKVDTSVGRLLQHCSKVIYALFDEVTMDDENAGFVLRRTVTLC